MSQPIPEGLTPRQLGVRLDAVDSARLKRMEDATGVEAVSIARNALRAVLDYYEKHGRVVYPIVVTDSKDAK